MKRSRLHAVTFLVWALAATAALQLAPNPLYVGIVIGICALIVESQGGDSPLAKAFPILVGLSAVFVGVRIVLGILTTHGIADALVTLPSATLPAWLGGFDIGGSVELTVILQAVADGVVIVGVVAAFGAFNAVVSHYELVQAAPRALFEPGLVVVIALAFVPSTIATVRDVREADRARTGGTPVRRGRILRTLLPVLEGGMERALALADSMDARGFGRQRRGARAERVAGWLVVAVLVACAATIVALVGRAPAVAAVCAAVAFGLVVAAIVTASRATRRTRYRPRRVTQLDWAIMGASISVPLILALFETFASAELRWTPSTSGVPRFDPLIAGVLVLLALPALVPTEATVDVPAIAPGSAALRGEAA